MKAGHSKLDGYNATLPAMRPPPRLPTVVAPLPPPPASLLCAHTYALLPTAEPTQIPAPQDCAQANRAADRPASARPPPPPSPCKRPHSTIPRPCPLPRPEHLSYLHPRTRFTQSHHSRPFIGSTPNTQYTHSYLSSTRCLIFSPRLPHTPLTCRSSPSRISSANTTFSPRLNPSACKAANSPPFSTPPAPAHPLSPPSAVVPSFDIPIAETSSTASCRKPPPPVPSHTRPSPLLSSETVLPTPLPVAFALGPASMSHTALPYCPTDASPLPLTPPPRTTSPIAEPSHAPRPPSPSLASTAPLTRNGIKLRTFSAPPKKAPKACRPPSRPPPHRYYHSIPDA